MISTSSIHERIAGKPKGPYKVYKNFSDGRTVVFETKEEFDRLVDYFYRLWMWKLRLKRERRAVKAKEDENDSKQAP